MLCLRLLWLRQLRLHSSKHSPCCPSSSRRTYLRFLQSRRELSEHTHTVELESRHVVNLHLQILELTVVVLRVGGVLHPVLAQPLQLDHPVEDFLPAEAKTPSWTSRKEVAFWSVL